MNFGYIARALVLSVVVACAGKQPADETDPRDSDSGVSPGLRFAEVPAQSFDMGCTPDQEPCEALETAHPVTLTRAYLVSVTEVTRAEFEDALGYSVKVSSSCVDCGADCPAECVTWHEAAAFANATSDLAGLPTCYTCSGAGESVECVPAANPYDCAGYRLLTEAEWEAAARWAI